MSHEQFPMKFLRKTEIKLALFSSVIFLIKLYHLLNQSDENVTSMELGYCRFPALQDV